MKSTDVPVRDQVLADLAALGPVPGDGLGLLVQVRQVAVFADQVLGQLARLAGLVDSTGAFAAAGYSSAAAFLRHGCGRASGRAGELVATGRALPRLPATGQAMDEGRISFDAAHVISRAAGQISDDTLAAAAEQEMLTAATIGLPGSRSAADAARKLASPDDGDPADSTDDGQRNAPSFPEWVTPGLDPRELRRLGEDLTYRAGPGAVEERQRKRFERRYLSFGLTPDNTGVINGACSDALSMEIVRTAVEAFSPPGGTEDHRTAAQILTLACRAEISLIRWKDGLPLDMGRRYRTDTPALRRALTARDRGCRFPGCGLPATWCTAHHIRSWKRGGTTRLPNLVLLCFVHHHYFIHLTGWTLTGTADGLLRFTHPSQRLTLDSPLPHNPPATAPDLTRGQAAPYQGLFGTPSGLGARNSTLRTFWPLGSVRS